MEFQELVKTRRSCRKYVEAQVKKEDIEEIVKCALMAPSWKNSETGRYYVAISEDAKKVIYDALPDFNQNSSKNSSYIVTTFKKGISGSGNDYWGSYDLGLQNSYLVLKAKEMGYDTLIMGLRDEEKIREFFSIPNDEMMLPVIAIGKGSGELVDKPRKDLSEVLVIK